MREDYSDSRHGFAYAVPSLYSAGGGGLPRLERFLAGRFSWYEKGRERFSPAPGPDDEHRNNQDFPDCAFAAHFIPDRTLECLGNQRQAYGNLRPVRVYSASGQVHCRLRSP